MVAHHAEGKVVDGFLAGKRVGGGGEKICYRWLEGDGVRGGHRWVYHGDMMVEMIRGYNNGDAWW